MNVFFLATYYFVVKSGGVTYSLTCLFKQTDYEKTFRTIVIDKLWALSFAPTTATAVDPERLYFTAGPNNETDGIFGYLIKK
jgi:hypothetical protein